MAKAYNKKVQPRVFQEGYLVLNKIFPFTRRRLEKMALNYEGPYIVNKAFFGGAIRLSKIEGEDLAKPVNFDSIKRYYV